MIATLTSTYPMEYSCTIKISKYLKNTWGWECNEDEILYLLIHIARMQQKNTQA